MFLIFIFEWIWDSIQLLSKSSFALLLMLLWDIWCNRNSQVRDDVSKSAAEIVPVSLGWWDKIRSVYCPVSVPRNSLLQKWKPPTLEFVKLKVDAAFNLVSSATGLGGVFRDSEGKFLGGFSSFYSCLASARHGELVALLVGVKEACSRHFGTIGS